MNFSLNQKVVQQKTIKYTTNQMLTDLFFSQYFKIRIQPSQKRINGKMSSECVSLSVVETSVR